MSAVVTPTLLLRSPRFPHLLPDAPKSHPRPLPRQGREYGHINAVRDLQQEMDDLSEEEAQVEEIGLSIRNRGYSFLIPIGRTLTQQEEKNDADEDTDEETTGSGHGPPSVMEDDADNGSEQDLDASMEDMDQDDEEEDEEDEEEISSDT